MFQWWSRIGSTILVHFREAKVLEVDLEDGDANISFLQHSSKCDDTPREPLQPDERWIYFAAVLAVIDPPVPAGKRGRQYKLNKDTVDMIEQLHAEFLRKIN